MEGVGIRIMTNYLIEEIIDQTGSSLLKRESVLDACYCELFDYIVNGLISGYDKDLILKLSKEKLLQTKDLLDNYCEEEKDVD